MDRRLVSVLAGSLVFALLIAGVFYRLVAGSARRGRAKIEMRDVVIAAKPLPPGVVVAAADIRVAKIPAEQFPNGGFSRPDQVVGRPVSSSVLAEEPIREGRLAPRGSGLGLGPVIPPGMRAVSIRVNDVVGVAGFVLPGMRVDVLATGRPPHAEGSVTRTILQDIAVLSAGQHIEPDGGGKPVNVPVVTLLVSPAQAEILALASEWRIQLVLRNGSDRKIETTPGRELAQMFVGAGPVTPAPAPNPRARRPAPAARPPAAAPPQVPERPVSEEIVVIRGTQKTVEQVGVKRP